MHLTKQTKILFSLFTSNFSKTFQYRRVRIAKQKSSFQCPKSMPHYQDGKPSSFYYIIFFTVLLPINANRYIILFGSQSIRFK